MNHQVFCLMGPTASGKTDLACALSDEFPFELVSVDSSLIYRELNIGAAKPSADCLRQYPHHLINVCDLTRIYSVADFYHDLMVLLPEIWARGRYPLLVGGTMMYFHAIQQGLSPLPQASADIRAKILQDAHELGWHGMHQRFAEIDPQAAARVHVNDQQRIMRGLEIYYQSGKTWTSFMQIKPELPNLSWINLALIPEPRQELHQRIAWRLQQMLTDGLLAEVRSILNLPYIDLEHPALKSVGYRQAIAHLHANSNDPAWSDKVLFATRQLAKRQLTWLRGFPNQAIFTACGQENIQKMIAFIAKLLDNS